MFINNPFYDPRKQGSNEWVCGRYGGVPTRNMNSELSGYYMVCTLDSTRADIAEVLAIEAAAIRPMLPGTQRME